MASLTSLADEPRLRLALRELYSGRFVSRIGRHPADPQYPGVILIERSIARLAGELSGELLDVGCGTRPYAPYFGHMTRVRACDHNAARGEMDFSCPAHQVPLPNASLDSILCTEVLEHVPDPTAVWQEFGRLIRPGGKVLLSTPMYWPSHEEPFDFFRYTGFGLIDLAGKAGFDVVKLYPRGGVWAFFAQSIQHTTPQYLPFAWQRAFINQTLLAIDRRRCNPRVTIGWTVLAVRR